MASDLSMFIDMDLRKHRYVDEDGVEHKGYKALALQLKRDPHYFSNKCSATCEGAHLSPDELVAVMDLRDNYSILNAFAREINKPHVVIPLDSELGKLSKENLFEKYLHLVEDQGETAAELRKVIIEGRITEKHYRNIKREFHEDIQLMIQLDRLVEGMVINGI